MPDRSAGTERVATVSLSEEEARALDDYVQVRAVVFDAEIDTPTPMDVLLLKLWSAASLENLHGKKGRSGR